jgi:MFS family permease
MITLATYGVGMLIGFWFAGIIAERYSTADGHDWNNIWMIPAVISFVIMLLFALLFKQTRKREIDEGEAEKGLAQTPIT